MRVIIAGSRDVTQRQFDEAIVEIPWAPAVVVCGMARGVDLMGRSWAKKNGILVAEFPANWNPGGGGVDRSAGYKRNVQMANNADALFAIWDGESKGTKHMIDIAMKKGLPISVHIVADAPQ